MSPEFIGILPAAGLGTRLHPSLYPKELLPVAFAAEGESREVRPALAIELALHAMRSAGVTRCHVIVSEAKWEILRYLGDGQRFGLDVAYLMQVEPRGLADAVDQAYAWTKAANVCMVMPDTVLEPRDAVGQVMAQLVAQSADLVLGVFPAEHPERLGPVRFAADGRVFEVLEKPEVTDLRHVWGVAAWTPAFSELLHQTLTGAAREAHPSLSPIFDLAIRQGMNVRAHHFPAGLYIDIGTPEGLRNALTYAVRGLAGSGS
jgi:glucose-1-phosphate thymidylyltransferase